MKILTVSEFDPGGVALGHRDLLRAAGHDARVATQTAYTERQAEADWVAEQHNDSFWGQVPCDVESLRTFAAGADVIQFCPGIGQLKSWADSASPHVFARTRHLDPPHADYFGIRWAAYPARRVALFHGSAITRGNLAAYRELYRGYALAATTVDYSCDLRPCGYLPPLVEPPIDVQLAPLRREGEPLTVAHCPTNPAIASTDAFMEAVAVRVRGIRVRFVHRAPWRVSLNAKATSHACFDHLRGAFSINTLEGMALGCVPLVGIRKPYLAELHEREIAGWPALPIENQEDLVEALATYSADAQLTRHDQRAARAWFETHFNRAALTARLVAFYAGL